LIGARGKRNRMTDKYRLIGAMAAGCVAAVVIAVAGFQSLHALWPAYALAEPTKAYTLAMYGARLSLGVVGTAGAAWVTNAIARDNGRAAWWLGGTFLAVSLPVHLYVVWDDYPASYHFLYLSYLVPVAGLTPRALRGSSNVKLGL
jgi:hypothetical protein